MWLLFLQDFWISAAGGGVIYPASRNLEILGKPIFEEYVLFDVIST